MTADPGAVPPPERVRIEADPATGGPYDVLIHPGVLRDAGSLIVQAVPAHRYAIITDDNVADLYAGSVADSLVAAGREASVLVFPAGERSKTRETWARLTDEMTAAGFGRDVCVLALGGGVVGDMAGFVAATFMRGVPFVNVPTSLLAMLDSAVGGKTGVDTPGGKNLVGAFHQPGLVLIDPDVLSTLPETEYRASLSEAVKHGVILDREYFEWIAANRDAILSRARDCLGTLVRRSVELKASVVAIDTFESGQRAILNFGHTLGHAIEQVSGYSVSHGCAIAIGMVLEARLGEALGVTEPGTAARIGELLERFDLATTLDAVGAIPDAIVAATRTDKKGRGGTVRYALPSQIGSMSGDARTGWTQSVDDTVVRRLAGGGDSAISQAGTEF
jgi:3-dehydroquinate synthase